MKFVKKNTNANKKDALQAYLMLAPQIIGFFLFSMLPLIYISRYCLYDYDNARAIFVGFDNFIRIFTRDEQFWISVGNTFIFTFGKLLIEIPLALFLAILLSKKLRGSDLFKGIFFMPNILSTAVVALIFSFLFSTFDGVINSVLMNFGLVEFPINWLGEKWTAMFVLMLVSIWQNFGINMLLLFSGVQGIPSDVYESSSIDGATGMKQFWLITLPMLMPVFKIVLMLAIIGSMTMTDLVLVLTNGGPAGGTSVTMLYIYQKFFGMGTMSSTQEIGYASAMGVVAALILVVLVVLYKKITNKIDKIS